jgi:hypothetical protein
VSEIFQLFYRSKSPQPKNFEKFQKIQKLKIVKKIKKNQKKKINK